MGRRDPQAPGLELVDPGKPESRPGVQGIQLEGSLQRGFRTVQEDRGLRAKSVLVQALVLECVVQRHESLSPTREGQIGRRLGFGIRGWRLRS